MRSATTWLEWVMLAGTVAAGGGLVWLLATLAGLPIQYNVRNVLVRWRSSITTILGIGAVVAVFRHPAAPPQVAV